MCIVVKILFIKARQVDLVEMEDSSQYSKPITIHHNIACEFIWIMNTFTWISVTPLSLISFSYTLIPFKTRSWRVTLSLPWLVSTGGLVTGCPGCPLSPLSIHYDIYVIFRKYFVIKDMLKLFYRDKWIKWNIHICIGWTEMTSSIVWINV